MRFLIKVPGAEPVIPSPSLMTRAIPFTLCYRIGSWLSDPPDGNWPRFFQQIKWRSHSPAECNHQANGAKPDFTLPDW